MSLLGKAAIPAFSVASMTIFAASMTFSASMLILAASSTFLPPPCSSSPHGPSCRISRPTSSTISTTQRPLKFSFDDETIGKALSSPLFIQEREEPASRRQAYHCLEESLLPSQSLSVCHVRKGRPVHELSSLGSSIRENPSRDSENEQIRILFER